MFTFRVKLYTGPTLVREIAARVKEAGFDKVEEGTQDVYTDVEATERDAAVHNVLVSLERKHGTSYGLRPSVLFQVRQEAQ